MKRIMTSVALAALVLSFAFAANARVIDYTEDTENFPNMLTEDETCSQAYEDFLSVAQPLNACRHLQEAKEYLAAQNSMKSDMSSIKNCKDCTKMMVQADEAAAAYKEQIKLYSKSCPSASKQTTLASEMKGKIKTVCKHCKGKWPGTLGPAGKNPCK